MLDFLKNFKKSVKPYILCNSPLTLAFFIFTVFGTIWHESLFKMYSIVSGDFLCSAPFFGFLFFVFVLSLLTVSTFFFSVQGVHVISTISLFFFWVTQFFFINKFFYNSTISNLHLDFTSFFGIDTQFSISFYMDFVSFSFLFLTTSIGVCAVSYSLTYFKNEPNSDRFILFLNWFIASMSLLVISDNVVLIFLGWELIVLTSFFLINFWTTRRGTLRAALKAFIFNKASDVFFLFFIAFISSSTGTLSVAGWFSHLATNDFVYTDALVIATCLATFAASIKSAQFGPHIWLPDSMEAPIPASALIHSATLVSAGVFLLLRFYEFVLLANLQYFIGFLGALTACFGAVVSASQTDCKKLLAYSTISHCGFLFITVSLNNFGMTILYLYLHGFFKAMTFFCVGNVVRYANGSQDCRKMGALILALPVETVLLSLCAFNLGALPITVGYLYKHFFQIFLTNFPAFSVFLPFLLFGMLCSCIYVFRLVYYSIFDVNKGYRHAVLSDWKAQPAKTFFSNTTVLSVLFIVLSMIFAFYVSRVYGVYLLLLDGLIANSPSEFQNTVNVLNSQLAMLGFLYFYGFFGAVFFIIMSAECRAEFSSLKKKYIYTYFIVFMSFCFLLLTNSFFC